MTAAAWLRGAAIAHRGLHCDGVPENSLPAIDAALALGYPCEIDVRLSADGEAMVFHDADLTRMTGIPGALRDRSADALAGLALQGTAAAIPRLIDVLDLAAGRAGLLVEVKTAEPGLTVGPLEARVAEVLSSYRGPVAIQSFHPGTVRWFAAHAPDLARGFLSQDYRRGPAAGHLPAWARLALRSGLAAVPARPHFIAYEASALTTWPPRLMRRFGLPVLAWTVRDTAQADAVAAQCDGMIFENFRPERPKAS